MCMFVAVALTLTQGPVLRKNTASVISVSLKTLFRGTESYPGAALDEDHRLYWSVREYAMTVGVYTLWPVASLRYHIRYDRWRLFVFVIKYAMTGGVSSSSSWNMLWPSASSLSLLFHAGQAAIKLPIAEASKRAQCTSPGQYTPYIKGIMKTP